MVFLSTGTVLLVISFVLLGIGFYLKNNEKQKKYPKYVQDKETEILDDTQEWDEQTEILSDTSIDYDRTEILDNS